VGHALATIQRAIDIFSQYSPSQYLGTIMVSPGTYAHCQTPSYQVTRMLIDGGNAANTTITGDSLGYCFVCTGGNQVTFQNFTVIGGNTGNLGGSITCSAGGNLTTNNTRSGLTSGAVFESQPGGYMTVGNHVFAGNAFALFWAEGGFLGLSQAAFTINSAMNVYASAWCSGGGQISTYGPSNAATFYNPGYVTGNKYYATGNGIITTNGMGVNYFPGSLPGSLDQGGQYS
jgi:hypothetical protein